MTGAGLARCGTGLRGSGKPSRIKKTKVASAMGALWPRNPKKVVVDLSSILSPSGQAVRQEGCCDVPECEPGRRSVEETWDESATTLRTCAPRRSLQSALPRRFPCPSDSDAHTGRNLRI